jgi:hypothetical protein
VAPSEEVLDRVVHETPDDSTTWPDGTIVLRGGVNAVEELRAALQRSGGISFVARPGATLDELAASVPNNRVRWTTLGAVRRAGGRLVRSPGPDAPPDDCDVLGLTPEGLDSILSPAGLNPVPREHRWRGAPT